MTYASTCLYCKRINLISYTYKGMNCEQRRHGNDVASACFAKYVLILQKYKCSTTVHKHSGQFFTASSTCLVASAKTSPLATWQSMDAALRLPPMPEKLPHTAPKLRKPPPVLQAKPDVYTVSHIIFHANGSIPVRFRLTGVQQLQHAAECQSCFVTCTYSPLSSTSR